MKTMSKTTRRLMIAIYVAAIPASGKRDSTIKTRRSTSHGGDLGVTEILRIRSGKRNLANFLHFVIRAA